MEVSKATQLFTAVLFGDHKKARFLLTNGANPYSTDSNGYTPLFVAIQEGHLKVVEVFLEKGYTKLGFPDLTPLHVAAKDGKVEIATLIIEKLEQSNRLHNVNLKDNEGRTPLHYAAMNDCEEVIYILYGAGANLEVKDIFGKTPLHLAFQWGKRKIVHLLLEKLKSNSQEFLELKKKADEINDSIAKLRSKRNLQENLMIHKIDEQRYDIGKLKGDIVLTPTTASGSDSSEEEIDDQSGRQVNSNDHNSIAEPSSSGIIYKPDENDMK